MSPLQWFHRMLFRGSPTSAGYEFTLFDATLRLHGSQLWAVIPTNRPAANDRWERAF